MKMLKVLLIALSLSCVYCLPAISAKIDITDNPTVQQEPIKHMRKGPRHHRGMSIAMMKDLNLSEEQKTQWKELSAQKKAEIQPLRQQMKTLREQERKINEKYENKIKKILTESQLKKYESMLPQKHLSRPTKDNK